MRRDDVANKRLLDREVRCYNCQRPTKREVINHYGEKPNEKYSGNLEIKREIPIKDNEGKIRYNYELYTGKWIQKFGFFCSVNCGLVWACHEIQRRIDNRKGSPRNPLPPEERSKLQKIMDNLKENK